MPQAWFTRSFAAVDDELLAPTIERLRGTPARLEERLATTPAAKLTAHVDDTWSIQQNVGHLLDLEALWLARVDDFARGAETLRPADLENRATHDANHDAADLARLLRDFRGQRARLVAGIEAMDAATRQRTALHPRLRQPMRVVDLAHFVAEHDDHHLARISELLRSG